MQFRKLVFQLHWLLGISAGLVLAVVGATGALLSFEDGLLRALDDGVLRVEPRGEPLSPAALAVRALEQRPALAVQALTLERDPRAAAAVRFAPGPEGGRGERAYLDPYSGTLLGEPRGAAFFRSTMQLHRWLAAGEVGKQVVGASSVALLFFCASGLYLRWPRRRRLSPRTWLALDWRQKGGAFLWQLHAVLGTWVLLAYLVMALSGLWWSYGWYRQALQGWAGLDQPMPTQVNRGSGVSRDSRPRTPAAGSVAADGTVAVASADRGLRRSHSDGGAAGGLEPDVAWSRFVAVAPDWASATLGWPDGSGQVQVRWLEQGAAHERAWNTLVLAGDGGIASDQRYAQRPWRQRLVGSIFAVHRGSYFGLAGVWVFMLASAAMPVFAVTGWMLYLRRRRLKRVRSSMRGGALAAAAPP